MCPVLHELCGDGVCWDGALVKKASRPASKFVDGSPLLAARVLEVDGIDKCWYAPSMFNVSGGGNLSTDSSVSRQKHFQSALRKLQRFTGSLWAGTLSFGGFMREGRCCDFGNFPRTRLSGSWLSWPKLVKARSGLVPTFHRWDKNLAVSLGYTTVQGCWMLPRSPGSHRQGMFCCNPSWRVGSWSHHSIQTRVWERRYGR